MAAEEKRPVRTRGVNPAPNRTRGLAARKLRGVPRHGTVLGSETDRRLRTTRTPDTRRRPGARAHESRAATGLHLAQARLVGANTASRPSPTDHVPQSQSLFRSYGSILPTSLTYISLYD
ncbi:hypothetical protein M8J77_011347 [Diaphorina citri]|nr:hypothetical protein M8J77_011347 [Diaphorina citri]